jgi:hypothetical protein
MQIKRFILLAGALVALALPTSALAGTGHVCRSGGDASTHVELTVDGASCGLAVATTRAAIAREWPKVLRVQYGGRSYLLRRSFYTHRAGYFSALYDGGRCPRCFAVGLSVDES